MTKTNYTSVEEIETMFDEFWVPFDKKELGTSDTGIIINAIVDEKSGKLYIERFEPITENITVYSFEGGNHPTTWLLEEGGSIEATL